MSFEVILILIQLVLLLAITYTILTGKSAIELHVSNHIKLLKQEIECIEDNPDYDLPTYEGIALRERWEIAHKELDILEEFIN